MPSCHDQPEVLNLSPLPSAGLLTVALAGNPNSGKTTLFNGLTGLRQKVANYPGVTVEKKTGRCKLPPAAGMIEVRWVDVIDLPGTYSLISRSPDEHVAMEVLRGLRADTRTPDVVVVVVDASNLQRNLYLVSQIIELGRPMVVALNMMDIAERRGLKVSPQVLSEQLGVPVIPIVGHKKKGIDELKAAIAKAAIAPLPAWPLQAPMRDELLLVAGGLAVLASESDTPVSERTREDPDPSRKQRDSTLESGSSRVRSDTGVGNNLFADHSRPLDRYEAIAERLLIGDHAADLISLAARPSVKALLDGAHARLAAAGIDPMQADIEAHYKWIDGVAAKVVTHREKAEGRGLRADVDSASSDSAFSIQHSALLDYASPRPLTATDKVDAVLIHKVWGLVIFAIVMAGLFVSIFWAASPIMDALKDGVKWLGDVCTANLADGPLKSLLVDGVFGGVGGVVVFVPQIAMLFCFIAILEDSGYLARAAFLMDRLLGKVGLSGKAFIPLLSSFACAIPGIMATRTIENRRDRLATIFIAPFMSCSARLPVYALLIGAFFAPYGALAKGGILLACYGLGIIAAVITAFAFKRSFLKGPAQAFILELPTYKLPQVSQVARVVWSNTSKFLTKAGTVIFCLSVVLWALNYYPRLPEEREAHVSRKVRAEFFNSVATNSSWYYHTLTWPPTATIENVDSLGESPYLGSDKKKPFADAGAQAVRAAQSEYSIAGRIGHFIEPAIRPLGFDWKMGVGLVSAFAAREVFVSSLGIVYSVGDVEDDTSGLAEQMKADHYANGQPVWTPLVAVSLLVWFVLAMQCMSTLAVVRRETGGWKWPVIQLVYMNALAYVACLFVFQVGSVLMR